MAEPRWRFGGRRCWRLSGVILLACGVSAAEPSTPGTRRGWHKARGSALVRAQAGSVAASEPETAPEGPDLGFARRGWFVRLSLGSGVFASTSGAPSDSRSIVGLPLSLAAYAGGTLSPHWSLGAGYSRDAIGLLSSRDESQDGDEPELGDTSFYLEELSAFLAAYPGPSSPYYGFATLGLGTLNVRKAVDKFEVPLVHWIDHLFGYDPSGVFVSVGAGYESWLNPRWALGVSARLLAGFLNGEELGDTRVTVLMPSLLVTLSSY